LYYNVLSALFCVAEKKVEFVCGGALLGVVMHVKKQIRFGWVVLGLLSCGCEPRVNMRGNITLVDNLQNFVVGKTKKDDVLRQCGSPSLCESDSVWIYGTCRAEDVAFSDVQLKSECVVRMKFDSEGVLASLDRIDAGRHEKIFSDEKDTVD
jgi:outer membrane protein assembly factor BamE (lipoprotein component of BamABCDE complex)